MRNKNCSKSLIQLILMAIIIVIAGVVSGSLNLGQVNEKVANLKNEEKEIEIEETAETTATIETEAIIAAYTPRRVEASAEAISRYNRARKYAQYITVDEVKISKDMDLTKPCNISREDFIDLMTGVRADTSGFFEENAGLIYDICEEYEINEIFFCGLISAESGWNIAGNHRRTHNYISLMNSGGLIQFSSVEEGLRKAASALHNNYLTPGGRFYCGKTLEAVRTRFCPVNPGWTDLVYGRMKQII